LKNYIDNEYFALLADFLAHLAVKLHLHSNQLIDQDTLFGMDSKLQNKQQIHGLVNLIVLSG